MQLINFHVGTVVVNFVFSSTIKLDTIAREPSRYIIIFAINTSLLLASLAASNVLIDRADRFFFLSPPSFSSPSTSRVMQVINDSVFRARAR